MTLPLRDLPDEVEIPYVAAGFSDASNLNTRGDVLSVRWSDLLWAAVTVGRPSWLAVSHDGVNSSFEAIFRWSMLRMALSPGPHWSLPRLHRTRAARALDPSEKGAISYFLGMTICKLFAAELLDTPWLLHLDTFGSDLHSVLCENQRPDLIGLSLGGDWYGFECKGRCSWPDRQTRDSAKRQAQRLVSVDGRAPECCIAAVTFFRDEILRFYWQDPAPESERPEAIANIAIHDSSLEWYYRPVFNYYQNSRSSTAGNLIDVSVSIHKLILPYLTAGRWYEAYATCKELKSDLSKEGYYPDGIKIEAGTTWTAMREPLERP